LLYNERCMGNPNTTYEQSVIYYAGMPMKTTAGFNIWVLCVIDLIERETNEDKKLAWKTFTKLVITQYKLKKIEMSRK
jgi:hypothetical protein